MNDQQIVDYLRFRGQVEPPLDLARSVMTAIDTAPGRRSWFSAYVPAFAAAGAMAVIAVLAVLLAPGRDVGLAPTPSITASRATVAELETALAAAVDRLAASAGVQGRQTYSVEGYLASATWIDWRPTGDQVVVVREDIDVSAPWWTDPGGDPLSVGQRIETTISVIADGHYYIGREGGWVTPLELPRGPLGWAVGMLSGEIPPIVGLTPDADVSLSRQDLQDGGETWVLGVEQDGESATADWHIDAEGRLVSYSVEGDHAMLPSVDLGTASTRTVIEFTPLDEPDPIPTPDVDVAPDPSLFGLPDDFPLAVESDAASDIDYHEYVEDVLMALETYHWETESIDWVAARSAALDDLPDDLDAAQAHQRIRDAIATFDIFGTAFVSPRDVPRDGGGSQGPLQLPSADRIGRVGHVSLPSPGEGGTDTLRDYLRAAHSAMTAIEATDAACGWIVDLRDYDGGGWGPPMWTLGGLLGPGRAVTFSSPGGEWGLDVGPDGVVTAAGFEGVDAAASPYIDTSFEHASDDALVAVRDDEPPYLPSVASPPVAVLVGNGTVSGGEQAAVAFLGRPNTRTFGGPTGGSPIVAPNLPMLDGAVLRMPIWVPVDREGERHTTNIMPDEVIGDTRSTGTDAVLDAALEWLEGQPGCS